MIKPVAIVNNEEPFVPKINILINELIKVYQARSMKYTIRMR